MTASLKRYDGGEKVRHWDFECVSGRSFVDWACLLSGADYFYLTGIRGAIDNRFHCSCSHRVWNRPPATHEHVYEEWI